MVEYRPRRKRGKGPGDLNVIHRPPDAPQTFSASVTTGDRARWNGFCEIESEPAFFNVILRQFGVKGVKVQEVISLDDETLMLLPRPVYGLIFLFRWKEEDPDNQEQSCPEEVWFANQTINNACASVALLNIINNIPDIELGDNLLAFKDFTASFSPALRGDAIGNFDFVRGIHNSFARKMDMLNGDLLLKNEATTQAQGQKRNSDENENDSGFHFIAFMPIKSQLWKLDGLERQPMCLGSCEADWLGQARPDIEARMAQSEECQIEFAILGLVQDPLLDLVPRLAENAKSVDLLSARLDAVRSDWRDFDLSTVNGDSTNVLVSPDLNYGVTEEEFRRAKPSEELTRFSESATVEDIITKRQQFVSDQASLRLSIKEEQQSNLSDEDRAAARKVDYGARLQNFVRKVKAKRQILGEAETS